MVASHLDLHVRYRLATPYAVQGSGPYDPRVVQGASDQRLPRSEGAYGSPVDQGVERGPDGWPLIPASSWRGRVRAHLESLLRGLGVPVCHPPDPARTCPHEGPVQARLSRHGRRFCPVCELFGSAWRPSRLLFTDLVHAHRDGKPIPVAERVNVSLNRFLGSAEEQRLVSYETAGGGEAGRLLEGRVSGDLKPAHVGLLLAALRLPTHLGGKKARGLGLIQQVDLQGTLRPGPSGVAEPVETGNLEAWIDQALEEVTALAAPDSL